MKGILLAGGRGTRLYPLTRAVSKHLLPVYDKPMFYYPLCSLMELGVTDVLVITNPRETELFRAHLGDGSRVGLNVGYAVQPFATGIADALVIGEEFSNSERVALALGDNVFAGRTGAFKRGAQRQDAVIYAVETRRPEDYGVVTIKDGVVRSIEEKPEKPKSNLAVTGLYVYPPDAASIARSLVPSKRGEFEITDVNKRYLRAERLHCEILSNVLWFDAGTFSGLLDAVNAIADARQPVGCIEETAQRLGLITREEYSRMAYELRDTDYGAMLKSYCAT